MTVGLLSYHLTNNNREEKMTTITYLVLDPEENTWDIEHIDGGIRFKSRYTDGWHYSQDEDDVVDIIERFGAIDEWLEDHKYITWH